MKYKEIVNYIIFGILTTLVNFLVYFTLEYLGIHYLICNALAIIISIIFAYITNKIWVFKSKTKHFKEVFTEFIKFIGFRGISSVIDMLLMIFFLEILLLNSEFSKIITAIIVIILNYISSKLIIFRR